MTPFDFVLVCFLTLCATFSPGPVRGRAVLEKFYVNFLKAIPNYRAEFPSIMYSGDTIIFEGVGHGTFTGSMTTPEGEVAPTGKSFNARYAFFAKISTDGLVAEDRTYFDSLDEIRCYGRAREGDPGAAPKGQIYPNLLN